MFLFRGDFVNGLLTRSKVDRKPIEIIYLNSDNKVTQRVIRVLTETDSCIKAYCYAKQQLRTFRKERILSADVVRKKVVV